MMPHQFFPDPRLTDENGVLSLGGDLRPEILLQAYQTGIFPWPIQGLPLAWFCPPERAVIFFDKLHLPRSLERARRRSRLRLTIDQAFSDVIIACSETPRPGQDGSWITSPMLAAYVELHRLGHAHSVEAWNESGELVGGIYGVDAGGAFAGESMFYREPYASKLALLHLIEQLRARGLEWMDIQMMTPHMEALGAELISRDEFLDLLARTRTRALPLFRSR
jgi:leucyl/phenylalanyl-tRNA--protein transferase